ncbi:MAG: hypothetical protein WD069_00465 [Planctomycetales bacterium]
MGYWYGPRALSALAAACVLAAGSALFAGEAESTAAAASPLDRLKARSADERWQELRARLNRPHSTGSTSVISPSIASPPADASARPASTEDWQTAPPRTAFAPPEPAPVLRAAPPERIFIEAAQPEPPRIDATPLPQSETPREPAPRITPAIRDPDPPRPADAPAPAPAADPFAPAPGTSDVPQLPGERGPYRATSNELKKVTDILPFIDYEPDPLVAAQDPCRNLCPRPDGAECKPLPDGRQPECPREIPIAGEPFFEPLMPGTCFAWQATDLFHNPLYFEDAQLERYGHTYHHCVQPFVSAGKFGAQLLGLPYQMAIDPMWKRRYVLGWYRPGECAPHLHYQIPLNAKAAAVQGGVTTGMFFLIP